ncbi:MAG TPA: lysophospholipid transporter LplT [Methylotenera sp.]|nr:lysophospholipid transporter LplT [Methylotenera sp.]
MTTTNNSLFSRGMMAVLFAQFVSALADNALLFAAIALLKSQSASDWQIPLLQEFFVIAFILLAPFVGPFADGFPKGRVMLMANCIKLLGAVAMFMQMPPLLAYGLVGIGAAAYSPAKYGILSELVVPAKLVKANGMIEGSTIVAILLGAVLGGKLADASTNIALTTVCASYLLAAIANLFIPKLPVARPDTKLQPSKLVKEFIAALKTLVFNHDARFSLVGTSIFWGTGSTLRLILVAWVPVALSINDLSMPANLSGAVAIGIAVGAALAANLVNLKNVNRVLPAGLLIGVFIMLFAHANSLIVTIILLVLVGAAGGFYVVPLNALLQERGHETVGAGNAVAVQNFFENCCMLTLIGMYILMQKNNIPVISITLIFGGIILFCIGLLSIKRLRQSQRL